VVVRAAREGAELRVTVTDTGAGPAPNARDGIGLSNTRERLAALYGALGGLSLDAAPGGGCRVAVSLPYRAGEACDRVAAGA
jgi:signal transduction histidine kinase